MKIITEISTSDVTASENVDYVPIDSRLLQFDVQESNHVLEVITSAPDFTVEVDERFELCLANPVQGALGVSGLIRCTTVVIEDCDSKWKCNVGNMSTVSSQYHLFFLLEYFSSFTVKSDFHRKIVQRLKHEA